MVLMDSQINIVNMQICVGTGNMAGHNKVIFYLVSVKERWWCKEVLVV